MIVDGGNSLGMGIIYTLHDGFTDTADKISGSFGKLEGITASASASIDRSLNRIRLASVGLVAGLMLLLPALSGIGASIEISDKLAEVTKTTGIAGESLKELKTTLEGIDTRTSVEGLLGIAKAGGSLGVAKNDIASFTDSIDKLNVALGDQFAGPEELARGVAQLTNNLKDVTGVNIADKLLKVGNVLNFMGANAKATESTIFDITNRLIGLQSTANLSSGELFGIATAMAETGLSSEVLGSNISLAMGKMMAETTKFSEAIGVSADSFRELANRDSLAAFDMFAMKLKEQNPLATDFNEKLKAVGLTGARMSNVFVQYASNIDNVKTRVLQANEALSNTNSVMDEFNAMNNTLQAVVDKTAKRFQVLRTRIGDQFTGEVRFLGESLMWVLDLFSDIVSNPFGKWLVRMVSIAGSLALAISAVVIAINLSTMAAGKAAIAFAQMGMAEVAATFASKGLVKGIMAVTKAGVASLIALWPYVLVGAAIAGVFVLIIKSIRSFDDVMSGATQPAKGFLGFMQKLGGVLRGVAAIWSSANDQGFTMSKSLADSLSKLGILEFVVNLGTWIVRIKSFFKGVGTAFGNMADVFITVFGYINSAFGGFFDLLGEFMFQFDSTTSSVERWARVGEALAYIVGIVLVGAFAAWAVSVIAATWPLLLIVAAVVGLIALFKNWDAISTAVIEGLGAGLEYIGSIFDTIGKFIDNLANKLASISFGGIIEAFSDVGKDLGLIEGEKSFEMAGAGDASPTWEPSQMMQLNAKDKVQAQDFNRTVVQTNTVRETVKTVNVEIDGEQLRRNINIAEADDVDAQ